MYNINKMGVTTKFSHWSLTFKAIGQFVIIKDNVIFPLERGVISSIIDIGV